MINLDVIMAETIDFTLNGELIKVQQPTLTMVKKINKVQQAFSTDNIDESFDAQCGLIAELLSNNTSNKSYSAAAVAKLPQKVQNVILTNVLKTISEVDNDPNS